MKWFAVITIFASWMVSGSHNANYHLTIKVDGIKSPKGNLRIAVFNSAESFKTESTSYKNIVIPVNNNQMEVHLSGIYKGTYAAAIYHDSNNNGKLDKNMFGIPTEYYGFSNNARGSFGKPEFDQCSFEINANKTISINLQ